MNIFKTDNIDNSIALHKRITELQARVDVQDNQMAFIVAYIDDFKYQVTGDHGELRSWLDAMWSRK